ncbi:MAG TPA: hypothetical protein VLA76_04065 [Candidatus Angelobacter sp.]|nr:hypothetical protein [Candidatus Angelobacter sp.]
MSDADVRISELEVGEGRYADLVEPAGGARGPAILYLHWFDTEAPDGNRRQFRDEAVRLAREHGVVSLLPDGRFPWAEPPTDADADVARIGAELAAHRAAIDLLAARDGVDAGRIGLVGHDFGAMHGIVLAAEDRRIAAVVAIAATPRWGDWFLPFWPISGDRYDYLRALGPFDPVVRVAAIAPRPILLQFARDDFYIAPMSGLELHRAAGEPKEIATYDADHAVRALQARADRTAFLGRALGWLG